MKLLFLDIDGVMNSITRSVVYGQWSYSAGGIDPVAVKLLRKIVSETGCSIVISSTWRSKFSIDFFKGLFAGLGYSPEDKWNEVPPIIGKTRVRFGELKDGTGKRGDQIQEYIDDWQDNAMPESFGHGKITHYVILDDDSDMLEKQLPHLVHTDTNVGLTCKDAEKAIDILRRVRY